MKVFEEDTDRRAEVHLHKEGKMPPVAEYGEYVDAKDGAICCYVPLIEDEKVKIRTNFHGTTLAIVCDGIIDGVLRKSSVFTAKQVTEQKNKKIELDTFLFKTNMGIIDTGMLVKTLSESTPKQSNAVETIGTIELRLYVTRQLGVTHTVTSVTTCSGTAKDRKEGAVWTTDYRQIQPTLKMMFEQDCALLDKAKLTREQNRMLLPRPGTEPWAIFRFHYRSQEAFLEHNLKPSFDPVGKVVGDSHCLSLDSVPPLPLGTKAQKDDGDNSTRASSPPPSDESSDRVKGTSMKMPPKTQPPTKKHKSTPSTSSSTMTTSKARKEQDHQTEESSSPAGSDDSLNRVLSDIVTKSSSKPDPKDTIDVVAKPAPRDTATTKGQKKIIDYHNNSVSTSFTKTTRKNSVADTSQKLLNEFKKSKNAAKESDAREANNTTTKVAHLTNNADLDHYHDMDSLFIPESSAPAKTALDIVPHVSNTTSKKSVAKPSPIITTLPSNETSSESLKTPLTATKRLMPPTDDHVEPKRAKTQTTLSTPTPTPRLSTHSTSPKTPSIEQKLAEKHKRLAEVRQRREKMAERQSAIDKEMEPYQKRIQEEDERMARQLAEEEALLAEEEEQYLTSQSLLNTFKNENSGD